MSHSKMPSQTVPLPHRRNALAVAISAAVAHPSAEAQQAVIEEITVTATKREASIQDVPLFISAFDTEDIGRRGFRGIDDYAKAIPDLAWARREPGGTSVVFRGVAASGIQFGTNPSSGVYLDEQPITDAGFNPNPRLIDIERLEALSGPQGTLFGDASQSGTLRIITNKPDPEAFDGWVEAAVSTVEDGDTGYDVSGMVNIPLAENRLAIRLVGFYEQEAGFIDNVLGGSPDGGGAFDNADKLKDDVNEITYWGGRAALRWLPDDKTTVDISAIYQDTEVDGFGDRDFDQRDLNQVRFNDETAEDEWYQLGLTFERKFGFGDFVLAASYFDREFRYDADGTDYQFAFQAASDYYEAGFNAYYGTDYDFYFYDFRPPGQRFGGSPRGAVLDENDSERWSVEARLATPADSGSRWQGIVGVFYQEQERSDFFSAEIENFTFPNPYYVNYLAGTKAFYYLAYNAYNLSINGLPPGSWEKSKNWFYGQYDQEIDQFAAFGEATFDVTESFSITAGGRYYDVDRKQRTILGALRQGATIDPDVDFITANDVGDESDSGFVPKINLTYRFDDDKLVYATYSEGFRSGGANALRPNSVLPKAFDSDEVQNYEFGAKTSWLGNRLYLNFTAYFMQWDDIQIQIEDPQDVVFQLGIDNFPEAEIKGAQLAFVWVPAEGWDISGNVAYNNAEISKTDIKAYVNEDGDIFELPVVDGTDLPITPDWKGTIGVEYTFSRQLFGAEPFARFDVSHVGESINALEGLEATVVSPPPTIQDSYTVGDAQVGLEADAWSATLSLFNVWDEDGETFINNRYAKRRVTVNRPRTLSLRFRYRF